MEKVGGGEVFAGTHGEVHNALRLVLMIFVTRCQILRLKCSKFDFGWDSAPDRAGGAYSAQLTAEEMGGKGDLLHGLGADRRPWSIATNEFTFHTTKRRFISMTACWSRDCHLTTRLVKFAVGGLNGTSQFAMNYGFTV